MIGRLGADAVPGATRSGIGVFGGTFDPIHVGHLIVAAELRHALELNRVLFVPAGHPPQKPGQAIGADEHRLAMLELALQDAAGFEINRVDLDRQGPSYTVDTLRLLTHQLDGARLCFLMGEDSLRDLATWHEPSRLVALAELGVARRPGVDVDLDAVCAAIPAARGRVHLVTVPEIGISSRDIRRRVATGSPIAYQVPQAVERYIDDHQLYRDT